MALRYGIGGLGQGAPGARKRKSGTKLGPATKITRKRGNANPSKRPKRRFERD